MSFGQENSARGDKELILAVKHFKCDHCESIAALKKAGPVKAPSAYYFNYEILFDLFDIHDDDGEVFVFLSILCNGTTFHVACLVRVGFGVPSSRTCYNKFLTYWKSWAGFPSIVTCDRGMNHRGAFRK